MIVVRNIIFEIFFYLWAVPTSIIAYGLAKLGLQKSLRAWCRIWCGGIMVLEDLILGLKSRLTGTHNVPQGAYILAAKHQSMWEAMLLPYWFNGAAIVLKAELLTIPFWGLSMSAYGAIPVERSRKGSDLSRMLDAATTMAKEGRVIVIFPQGTRVKPGDKKPYHKGIALLYEHLNIPVAPMLVNSGHFWPKGAFLRKSGVARAHIAPAIPAGLSRDEFMRRLEAALEADMPEEKG